VVPAGDVPPAPAPGWSDLSGIPFWSAVFSLEDCIWAAVHPSGRPRVILKELWTAHHVRDAAGRLFEQDATDNVIREVCEGRFGAPDPAECSATAFELVFEVLDARARALVRELEDLAVLTGVGRTTLGTFVFGEPRYLVEGVMKATHSVEGPRLVPLPAAAPVAVTVTSGALLRGFCMNTTQLAVLFAVGTQDALAAVAAVVNFSNPSGLPRPDLAKWAQVNADEILGRLAMLKPPHTSSKDNTLESLVHCAARV